VQQFRFDSFYQEAPGGIWTDEYGGSKGLEIIPNTRMEAQVGIPPYFFHEAPNMPDGFGDVSILLKSRVFSAPEGQGRLFSWVFPRRVVSLGNPAERAGIHGLVADDRGG
jgi:hypothetical protein